MAGDTGKFSEFVDIEPGPGYHEVFRPVFKEVVCACNVQLTEACEVVACSTMTPRPNFSIGRRARAGKVARIRANAINPNPNRFLSNHPFMGAPYGIRIK